MRIREPSWMTVGIALLCGVLYYLGYYSWAFWVIILGIVLAAIGAVVAVRNPRLLLKESATTSFLPLETALLSQYILRAIIIIIFLVAAWNLAKLAGYL